MARKCKCYISKSKLILCEYNAFYFSEIAVIGFTVHEIKQGIVFFGTPGIYIYITILKQTPSYRSGAKNCDLCLQEKLHILKGDKTKLLNKRCELFSKCRHRKRFLAAKFERACAVPSRV